MLFLSNLFGSTLLHRYNAELRNSLDSYVWNQILDRIVLLETSFRTIQIFEKKNCITRVVNLGTTMKLC